MRRGRDRASTRARASRCNQSRGDQPSDTGDGEQTTAAGIGSSDGLNVLGQRDNTHHEIFEK